jgi:DNA-binding CsgD family transcriptional regulator
MGTDAAMSAALGRLTANEKECLRRRLLPQTAKEMALDLGVSPHAVEKRLKMARTKLGLSSSLAAARLLADAEQYHRLVPQGSDLTQPTAPPDDRGVALPRWARPSLLKGLSMIAAVSLIAYLAQDAMAPNHPAIPSSVAGAANGQMRRVEANEAAAFLRDAFRLKDSDGSGYLDPGEASSMEPRDAHRDGTLPPAPAPGARDPAAERKWMAKLDTDRDDKVSEQEYISYMLPWILWQGVPVDWAPPG